MLRTVAVTGVLACTICASVKADESAELLRTEMQQRNSALVQRGFNLTNKISLGGDRSKVAHIDLLVPPPDQTHELSFWAHAVGGDITFKVTTGDDRVLASWAAQSGETNLTLVLPAGRTRVEVDGSHAESVFAVLGVNGPVLRNCQLDPARVSIHAARVSAGFRWAYLLYMPPEVRGPWLLAAPNNTGFATTDTELLAASGACTAAKYADLADGLGTPLLVPLFPRPSIQAEEGNLYLHALTRASLSTQVPEFTRVDLQFVAMLDDATGTLANQGVKVPRRVLLTGFSASGSFVSRFAMLHPDRVLAVASGSPGGWPIVPAARDGGSVLPYPVGIADLKVLAGTVPSISSLRQVAWFYFMGDADTNDSVPYRDSFSKADETLVFQRFGSSLTARWQEAARIYHEEGLNAQFTLYPGVAHHMTPDMEKDIAAFFLATTQGAK
jgi:hypothetical protein